MLATLLITSVILSHSNQVPFGAVTVSNPATTEVVRNGKVLVPEDGGSVELETGDIVRRNLKSNSSGSMKFSDGTTLSLIDNAATILYQNDDEFMFYLKNGTIFYSTKGVIPPKETIDSNGMIISPSMGTGRGRLVRTSQRSLGTRGTEFRLQVVQFATKEEVRLKVIEGFVTCDPIGDVRPGQVYGEGQSVKFMDAKPSTLK